MALQAIESASFQGSRLRQNVGISTNAMQNGAFTKVIVAAKASRKSGPCVFNSVQLSAFGAVSSSRSLVKSKASANGNGAPATTAQKAEYIWSDGQEGDDGKGILFNEMRSKTKILEKPVPVGGEASGQFPDWSFDGSSTNQAAGEDSDCILRPVFSCPDPIRGAPHVLVLCEVYNPDGETPHTTNTRAKLTALLDSNPDVEKKEDPWFGFEQEYTMMGRSDKVFGWPKGEGSFPAPQGPFYCGVGLESVYGRPLAEKHLDACLRAGLTVSGINAEVMPGQWEYQIGPVGPRDLGDHTMISRWLLHRLGEDYNATITFEPKPVKGDWNGTGAHTNFSTAPMREKGGMEAIKTAIERLSKTHKAHIDQYGKNNEQRLTGKHETASIDVFSSGVADRGASIRIPRQVEMKGYGYLEDRRPSANVDPYVVGRMLIQTCLALEPASTSAVAR